MAYKKSLRSDLFCPNVTGVLQGTTLNADFIASGAFTTQRIYQIAQGGGSYATYGNTFNASGSNSIYTENGKVTPLSLSLNFIIKI